MARKRKSQQPLMEAQQAPQTEEAQISQPAISEVPAPAPEQLILSPKVEIAKGDMQLSRMVKRPKPRPDFDAWFAQQAGARRISPNHKDQLLAHMKAYGFYQDGRFEDGIRHFGLP